MLSDKGLSCAILRKSVSAFIIVCCLCLLANAAVPSEKNSKQTKEIAAKPVAADNTSAPKALKSASAEDAVSVVTEAAVKGGVLTCAKRIDRVVKFLTSDTTQHGALLFFPQKQRDEGVFSVSFELDGAEGAASYASASFYPDKNGGCSASYDLVQYSKRSCADFASSLSSQKDKAPSVIKKDIGLIALGGIKIFLMPSAGGCTVIKKEVIEN
jgi:hypothetical protein